MAKNASDRALEMAQEFLDDLNIQSISDSVTQEYPGLDFTTLHESTNDELEAYITMYGGYRSYLEVELAEKAGLGWRGKHSLLLNKDNGSWFFLGEILWQLYQIT